MFKDDIRVWRWRLVQLNTLIIIESSESFTRRSDAMRAAEAVRLEIGSAPVVVL